jgi:NADP-dependent 3-hydroxy acid dehydrogenase YdfG
MIDSNANRIAIVTGSFSGIGFGTASTLLKNGFYTYATMHNLKILKYQREANKEALPLKIIQLDVNDDLSTKTAIQEIIFEKRTFYSL